MLSLVILTLVIGNALSQDCFVDPYVCYDDGTYLNCNTGEPSECTSGYTCLPGGLTADDACKQKPPTQAPCTKEGAFPVFVNNERRCIVYYTCTSENDVFTQTNLQCPGDTTFSVYTETCVLYGCTHCVPNTYERDDSDCTNYWYCSATGSWVLKSCYGYYFDGVNKCSSSSAVCGTIPVVPTTKTTPKTTPQATTPTTATTTECTPGTFQPMSGCLTYKECTTSGIWLTKSCFGYYFDKSVNKCVATKPSTTCPA